MSTAPRLAADTSASPRTLGTALGSGGAVRKAEPSITPEGGCLLRGGDTMGSRGTAACHSCVCSVSRAHPGAFPLLVAAFVAGCNKFTSTYPSAK